MAGISSQRIAQARIAAQRIAYAGADQGSTYNFPSGGTYSFTPPKPGVWKFVGWSAGGGSGAGTGGGGSGAYVEITKYLTAAQAVTIVAGFGGAGASGTATSVTFTDGVVASATGGTAGDSVPTGGAGGVATGGNVNLNGSAGVTSGATANAGLGTGGGAGGGTSGGAGAPANLPFRGGKGGTNVGVDAAAPGGGTPIVGTFRTGGHGLVLAFFIRP